LSDTEGQGKGGEKGYLSKKNGLALPLGRKLREGKKKGCPASVTISAVIFY